MAALTATQSKLLLLYLKEQECPPFARLSANVLREICCYLCEAATLYSFEGNFLSMLRLDRGEVTKRALAVRFNSRYVFCPFGSNWVLCASPDSGVFILDALMMKCRKGKPMTEARLWPGTICFENFVYMFGGNFMPTLSSCEKYATGSGVWGKLPNMSTGKVSFSPAAHQGDIFLCCPSCSRSDFEVFSPRLGTFRTLPVALPKARIGSIAFFVERTLHILTAGDKVLLWSAEEAEMRSKRLQLRSSNLRTSNAPPVVIGRKVYWISVQQQALVVYDSQKNAIAEEAHCQN